MIVQELKKPKEDVSESHDARGVAYKPILTGETEGSEFHKANICWVLNIASYLDEIRDLITQKEVPSNTEQKYFFSAWYFKYSKEMLQRPPVIRYLIKESRVNDYLMGLSGLSILEAHIDANQSRTVVNVRVKKQEISELVKTKVEEFMI